MKLKIFNTFLLSSVVMLLVKISHELDRNRKPMILELKTNKAMKEFIAENQSLFPQTLRHPLNEL